MDEHLRTLRKEELLCAQDGWFDEENAERVVSWLIAAEDRSPVVLIGAGFSLNAHDRVTGQPATRAQAPLWSDIVRTLAADLAVSPDRYDALTLFEMYEEAFGSAKVRDKLLAAVADDLLRPGDAHLRLASYQCEAIVTMNCLDTLLDEACGAQWRRVVDDEDLSCSGSAPQLIYLHGHRKSPRSWVMTRSQYEDLAHAKPVMVTRVRQLLAQHPWLVVGSSLADHDFHAMTRLLGLEMRGHQPLSLVLTKDSPSAPERQHWRRLGFEIVSAVPNKRQLGEFFAWVFPKLATTYSPTSVAATAYIARATSPEQALRRFRQVNPDPVVKREAVFREWDRQLGELLTQDERTSAEDAARAASQAEVQRRLAASREGGTASDSKTEMPFHIPATAMSDLFRGLADVPRFRSIATLIGVRRIDCLLARGHKLRAELAEHFEWALERHLFDYVRPLPLMDVIAIRLAKDAGWEDERVQTLAELAFSSARMYEDDDGLKILEAEVQRLGLTVAPLKRGYTEPYLLRAQAAYEAFMNADFVQARKQYHAATTLAAAGGLDFQVWVYTQGQLAALRGFDSLVLLKLAEESADQGAQRIRDAELLSDQIERLEQGPVVDHWLKQADARSRTMLRQQIDVDADRARHRRRGGASLRFSSAAPELWRTYRELSAISAPPPLQGRYVELFAPLLDEDDLGLVFAHVSKPGTWLDALLSRAPITLNDRKTRDARLIESFLGASASATKSEVLARLECAKALRGVVRTGDLPALRAWLEATAKQLRGGWQASARDSRLIQGYWDAFASMERWDEAPAALELAKALANTLEDADVLNAPKAFYELPWHTWKLSDEQEAEGFLELVTDFATRVTRPSHGSLRDVIATAYSLFSVLRMLDGGLPAKLMRVRLEPWLQILGVVSGLGHSQTGFAEAKRAGFMLERKLMSIDLIPHQILQDVFERWFGGLSNDVESSQREEMWVVLCETLSTESNAHPSLLVRLRSEVAWLMSDDRAIGHYQRNPHLASTPVKLLVTGMLMIDAERAKIGGVLLELLETAPRHLDHVHALLVQHIWELQSWQRLLNLIIAACAGAVRLNSDQEDAGFATRCQLAALALFGNLDGIRLRTSTPAVWYALQGLALGSVTDERALVANYAAFAVAQAAMHVEDDTEASIYAFTIERIAQDARADVRSAIANSGLRLVEKARHANVRQAAEKAIALISEDDNAQVGWVLKYARSVRISSE